MPPSTVRFAPPVTGATLPASFCPSLMLIRFLLSLFSTHQVCVEPVYSVRNEVLLSGNVELMDYLVKL